jgi:hypothetical protein
MFLCVAYSQFSQTIYRKIISFQEKIKYMVFFVFLACILDLITSLFDPWEFDQY